MFGARMGQSQEYMLQVKELIESGNREEAVKVMYEGARVYENRVLAAVNDLPVRDAALMLFVMEHVLAELKRQDPKAVSMQKNLKEILYLPPVKFRRKK